MPSLKIFLPRFAITRKGYMYLNIVHLQYTLRIYYDDLGSYKELLHFIEAKAWRVNELVIFTIHLTKVTKDVIEVLAIDILPSFPIDTTTMFRKSGQVHLGKWLIVIQYTFLLG
jgi:hypothetical protein